MTDNGCRRAQNVACRKPKQAEASLQDAVLPAVVRLEAVPMRRSVVLDDKAYARVEEITSPQESPGPVTEMNLRSGPRQAAHDKEQPKSGFHWALGGCIRQIYGALEDA
ncbi:MAG TPA: hypothetical protein VJS19_12450 [Candidatus Dormibacteraeota bacterium]|nr:hypothetical protein [Candidatus Dormibacteraeota bacterium]